MGERKLFFYRKTRMPTPLSQTDITREKIIGSCREVYDNFPAYDDTNQQSSDRRQDEHFFNKKCSGNKPTDAALDPRTDAALDPRTLFEFARMKRARRHALRAWVFYGF